MKDQYRKREMSCSHQPPRSTVGSLGMLDSCKCGAVTFVLRYSGNDGSGRTRLRWDRWS